MRDTTYTCYKHCKFGCDQSVIKDTVSRFPLKGYFSRLVSGMLHTFTTNAVSVIVIGL